MQTRVKQLKHFPKISYNVSMINYTDTEIRLKLFSYSSKLQHKMFKPDRANSKELQSFLKKIQIPFNKLINFS